MYVSETGDDLANGGQNAPYQTFRRALLDDPDGIIMEGGQYQSLSTENVGSGTIISGGFKKLPVTGGFDWVQANEPTFLLLLGQTGSPGIVLANQAELSNVSVVGGFYSVELKAGARLSEVEFLGGEFASVVVREEHQTRVASMERCRILGGATGVRIDNGASLIMEDCLVENTVGRGLFASAAGTLSVTNSVFQKGRSDGLAISSGGVVLFRNVVSRRNQGSGILVSATEPIIQGCLLAQNDYGIYLDQTDAVVENCTIVDNRVSGVQMRAGNASVRGSIIAYNERYGVQDIAPFNPASAIGGPMIDNIFWENASGSYLDNGTTPVLTLDYLHNELVNGPGSMGNRFEDPGFISVVDHDYRLAAGSSAIDQVVTPAGLITDLKGNSRTVESVGVGHETDEITDLGAYEWQDHFVTNFGDLFSDSSFIQNPFGEGVIEVQKSPDWEFNPVSVFERVYVDFFPSGFRMFSRQNGSFGGVAYRRPELAQELESIGIFKIRLGQQDISGGPSPRIRLAGPGGEVNYSYLLGYDAENIMPTQEGSVYEMVVDMHQGGYRTSPQDAPSSYPMDLFIDLLDFNDLPYEVPIDVTYLEAEFIDRELYDIQFGSTLGLWNFSSDLDGWEPFLVQGGAFRNPILRYNGTQRALEMIIQGDNTFGSWISPDVFLQPGQPYRIDFKISTDQPNATVPAMRLRFGAKNFEFSQDIIVGAFTEGGLAAPADGEIQTYVLYGRMPNNWDPTVPIAVVFDAWQFSLDNRTGSLFLHEATVRVPTN